MVLEVLLFLRLQPSLALKPTLCRIVRYLFRVFLELTYVLRYTTDSARFDVVWSSITGRNVTEWRARREEGEEV
jgi:hypothetical protein